MNSVSEVIDALGGNSAVARLTSSRPNAVSNWRASGRFPANTYLILKDILAQQGHAAPDRLWAMRAVPARRKRSA